MTCYIVSCGISSCFRGVRVLSQIRQHLADILGSLQHTSYVCRTELKCKCQLLSKLNHILGFLTIWLDICDYKNWCCVQYCICAFLFARTSCELAGTKFKFLVVNIQICYWSHLLTFLRHFNIHRDCEAECGLSLSSVS